MAANSRLATAVQALCVMAYIGPDGMTAEVIARSLGTNPVVVRRLLKDLERGRLVRMRPGKDGGAHLTRAPEDITLDAVGRAIAGRHGVFARREGGNPNCPVNQSMPGLLTPIFAATDEAVANTLARTTIADLTTRIPRRGA
jgi:DNA-binding IscR family transcriptional regulator